MSEMGMSNEIRVSSERLATSRSVIQAQHDRFDSTMSQIKIHMGTLAETWKGSAATEFLAQFNKLDKNFTAYKTTMSEYVKALTTTIEHYEKMEDTITHETTNLSNSDLFA